MRYTRNTITKCVDIFKLFLFLGRNPASLFHFSRCCFQIPCCSHSLFFVQNLASNLFDSRHCPVTHIGIVIVSLRVLITAYRLAKIFSGSLVFFLRVMRKFIRIPSDIAKHLFPPTITLFNPLPEKL